MWKLPKKMRETSSDDAQKRIGETMFEMADVENILSEELPEEHKALIDKSIKQIQNGRTVSYDQMQVTFAKFKS